MPVDGRIGCRKLVAADKDDVEEMVTKYFCPNEPLRSALEVVYPGKVDTEFVRKHAEECMSCNSSLMAYNIQTGETAGIILCEVLRYKDDQTMDDEKWKAKFRNRGVTTINAKLFETLNKNLGKVTEGKMCFRIYLATVNPSYGRLGIMSGLVERIELVAKDLGCDFIFMESTSLYTQRIASKLGY
uniref:aralkylamine N-acetyltransferase n=1 Tax=Ciona intestinalis TaxID=7719 RepID=F6S1R1_CIOIN